MKTKPSASNTHFSWSVSSVVRLVGWVGWLLLTRESATNAFKPSYGQSRDPATHVSLQHKHARAQMTMRRVLVMLGTSLTSALADDANRVLGVHVGLDSSTRSELARASVSGMQRETPLAVARYTFVVSPQHPSTAISLPPSLASSPPPALSSSLHEYMSMLTPIPVSRGVLATSIVALLRC